MCDKAVDKFPIVLDSLTDQDKTQEISDKLVSDDPFRLKYCHNKYRTQEMSYKTVDDFLPALKLVPDSFVTSKVIKNLLTALYADSSILYFNEDSGDSIFSCNKMGIINIDLNNINLDVTNYDENGPETITYITLLAWNIKFEKRKAFKKELNEVLMLLTWHLRRWWDFCMSEDEKKNKYNKFSLINVFNASVVYNMDVLEHFGTKNYTRRLDIVKKCSCLYF